MAAFSIRKPKGSRVYIVNFRLPDPSDPSTLKQFSRSTKQEKRSEAMTAAQAIVEAAAQAHKIDEDTGKGIDVETGRKVAKILGEAVGLAEAGKLSIAKGREILREMLLAAGAGNLETYTTRQWLEKWLNTKTEDNAKPGARSRGKGYSRATWERYSANVKQFLAYVPEGKADADLSLLTTDDVRQFRDALRAGGRTAATVNDAVRAIRTALNAARRAGLVVVNVAAPPELLLTEEEPIRATFSPEDVARLIEAATSEDWKGVILFGWFAGASLTDITNFRWNQIDLAAKAVTYSRRKTGVPVVVPIHPDLLDWLLSREAPDDGGAFVFPSLAGQRAGGRNGLSSQFNEIVTKAGIDGREVKPEGEAGYTRRALSFHSLRHSHNSALANAGVSQELRQALVGHTSAATNEGYTHRELEPLRAAIELLPSLPPPAEGEGPKGKRHR